MIDTVCIIIEQALLHLPLMCGAYISFSLLKVPDLSIESAYVVGALFGTFFATPSVSVPLGFLFIMNVAASLVGGAVVGITSSLLTQQGKLPHLLSSIITFGLFHGFNQLISPAYISLQNVRNPLALLNGIPRHPELLMLLVVGCVVALFLQYLGQKQIGYAYAVYGTNPFFFTNYGISTRFIFITGIMLANALAGLSGYLFAQSNTFVELNMGLGKVLLCITALILGKAFLSTKRAFSAAIPLVGTGAYFTLQQLLLRVGFNLKYFTAVQALLVLCILLYTNSKHPHRALNDNLGV